MHDRSRRKRPKEDFFAGKNNQCRYDHFNMGGGKIDAAMRCAGEGRQPAMQMAAPTRPRATMHMSMNVQGEAGEK